ncbi:unnamed protein product [Dovyalis caffra]|uniref:Uncharacterized protein n=1 Tax=Dovyalis caffra TaxID=77055 RepID=A0AAV1RXC4_9ROSI|nr:unnamed protein product [Dovyalis caffra]
MTANLNVPARPQVRRFFLAGHVSYEVLAAMPVGCDHIASILIHTEDCVNIDWSPQDTLAAPISSAIYSSDGSLVYTGFCDGAIGVFDADSLRIRCRIAPSAYMPSHVAGNIAYPFVIAAHPSEPNQIALGMSDGAVHVVEPSDVEMKWGVHPLKITRPFLLIHQILLRVGEIVNGGVRSA